MKSQVFMPNFRKILSDRLFIGLVVLPTILGIVYFGFIASDVYLSESRFVVRSPDKASLTGVGILLKNAGFSNANDEASIANDYIQSRDALRAIDRNGAFSKAYRDPYISVLNRSDPFGMSPSFEDLYKYFRGKVKVEDNSATGVTTLTVRAFKPERAQQFNQQLLEMAEATINRLNARARNDLIHYADAEVQEAEDRVDRSATALAGYRNHHQVVDPEKQAGMQLEMVSKLQDELIASRTQLAQLKQTAPDNPAIPVLDAKIASLTQQSAEQMGKVAGASSSLAGEVRQYQRRLLDNELAVKQLGAAMTSLEQARTEARRKQAYVERIAEPSLPDAPGEPHRLMGIIGTLVMGLIFWGIARMLVASVREHVD